MKFDVITFGSATLDIFLEPEKALVKKQKEVRTKRALCLPFSSKVDLKNLFYKTGGGGTNTAAAFSNLGLNTAYFGTVGRDFAAAEVLKDLEKFGVDTRFVKKKEKAGTNLSVILSVKGERTVLVFREASELVAEEPIPRQKLEAHWLYLAPLSGKARKVFSSLTEFAKQKGIRVFANPGNSQIELGPEKLKPALDKVDILLLNQEEASLLTGVSYEKEKKVFERLDRLVKGVAVMTKGKEGAVASDGKHVWKAGVLPVEVVEKTGAGDSFGSGFLSGFMEKGEIAYALQKGIANSASCISERGAKQGLLKKGQTFEKVNIEKTCLNNN